MIHTYFRAIFCAESSKYLCCVLSRPHVLRHSAQGSRGSRVPEMVPGQIRGILGFWYCAITGHVTGPFQKFFSATMRMCTGHHLAQS